MNNSLKTEQELYQRLRQDKTIFRMKRDSEISDFQLTIRINEKLKTSFTVSEIVERWENIVNLTLENKRAIFHEIQNSETDFVAISQKLGFPLFRVTLEILTSISYNLRKICKVIKQIPLPITLRIWEFQLHKQMQNLAQLLVEPSIFPSLRNRLSILWIFISSQPADANLRNISDLQYKTAYTELIMLWDDYKIDEINYERQGLFMRILHSHFRRNRGEALLNGSQEKNHHQTIDQVSELTRQLQKVELPRQEMTGQVKSLELPIHEKLVSLHHRMSELEGMLKEQNCSQSVKQDMSKLICDLGDILRTS